ncbi:hypothetical protein ABG067_007904, partial [Albugo candida]
LTSLFLVKRQLTGLGSLFSGTNNNTSASNHQEAITNMGDQRVPRNKSSAVDTYPEEDSFSVLSAQSYNNVHSEVEQQQHHVIDVNNDDFSNSLNADQLCENQYTQEQFELTEPTIIAIDQTAEETNINSAFTSQVAARDANINDVITINASKETIQDFTKNNNNNNNVTLNTFKQDDNSGLATTVIISNQDSTEDIIQDINIISGTISTNNDTSSSNVNDVIVNNTQDKVNPITENFTINTNLNTCQDLIKNANTSDTANENNNTLNDYHAVLNVTKDDTIISSTENIVMNTSQTITEDIIEDNIANFNNACQNTQITTTLLDITSINNNQNTIPNIIKDTRLESSNNQDINDNTTINNKQNFIGQAVSSTEGVYLDAHKSRDADTTVTESSEPKSKPIAQPKRRRGRPVKAKNSDSTIVPSSEKTTQKKTRTKKPLPSNRAQKRRKTNEPENELVENHEPKEIKNSEIKVTVEAKKPPAPLRRT